MRIIISISTILAAVHGHNVTFTCETPPCSTTLCGSMPRSTNPDECTGSSCRVDCGLELGYYEDPNDCRKYCVCTGDKKRTPDGTLIEPFGRHVTCPLGTFWDKDCEGLYKPLASGLGYDGGCCNYAWKLLSFPIGCQGACERLTKWHCGRSTSCSWYTSNMVRGVCKSNEFVQAQSSKLRVSHRWALVAII